MAVNAVSSNANTVQQLNSAASERRLEQQRQLRAEEQRTQEQQTQRTQREAAERQEVRRTEATQQVEQQDFLTLQQLKSQATNQSQGNPGRPARGSTFEVVA